MRVLFADTPDSTGLSASAAGVFEVDCWRDYLIEADDPFEVPPLLLKRQAPHERPEGAPWWTIINFGDYVGVADVGGEQFLSRSPKLTDAGFEQLLLEVTNQISDLPFDFNTPAFVPFTRDGTDTKQRLYHALVYLRWAMWFAPTRLDEVWASAMLDPHQTLERYEKRMDPWELRRVSASTVLHIISEPDRWRSVAGELGSTALARRLGMGAAPRLPETVVESVARRCVDTPENRFLKHFIATAVDVLEQASAVLASDTSPSVRGLLKDADELLHELHAMAGADVLREVGQLQHFPAHSQVLQKRFEYREVLRHYLALSLAARYPISGDDLRRIVETKSANVLYEYWCFFQVADAVTAVLGARPSRCRVGGDELHAIIEYGIYFEYPGGQRLWYNRSFSRGRKDSYSLPLRPDIVLSDGSSLHLFDAKFSMDRFGTAVESEEAEPAGAEAPQAKQEAARTAARRGDIAKMHAYKDALGSESETVRTVWVMFPGGTSDAVEFYADRGMGKGMDALDGDCSGVGAIPACPGDSKERLERVLRRLLSSERLAQS